MAKSPSKSPAVKISAPQKATATPLPRGADPAGQANSAGATQSTNLGAPRQASPGATAQNGSRPSAEQIAERAYQRYQERNGAAGSPEDDWYAAERELSGKAGGHQ